VLVDALVTSRIDYCNSLLYGLPQTQLSKLQRVQNIAARLICNISRFGHISPVLFELHWLPVHYKIIFKVLVITYKAINGMAPKYISDCYMVCLKLNCRSYSMFRILPRALFVIYHALIISHQCFLNFIGCLCITKLFSKF